MREKKYVLHKIMVPLACKEYTFGTFVPLAFRLLTLTLIRAAGGVYDFRNFEEVYLCNDLSSELQNSCIPQKTSREYILLST